MNPLLVYATSLPTEVVTALDRCGQTWKAVSTAEEIARLQPEGGWSGAVVVALEADEVLEVCRALRTLDKPVTPTIVALKAEWLSHFTTASDQFDDFILYPIVAEEIETRLSIAQWRAHGDERSDLITYGDIQLDVSTYQCTVSGRPLDLTYMEYELLRYLVTNPAQVFTREQLLQRVWGYEYYGGARTVDVHVRRLRAKIGEEHAQLIQTVRSVGYMFGKVR